MKNIQIASMQQKIYKQKEYELEIVQHEKQSFNKISFNKTKRKVRSTKWKKSNQMFSTRDQM